MLLLGDRRRGGGWGIEELDPDGEEGVDVVSASPPLRGRPVPDAAIVDDDDIAGGYVGSVDGEVAVEGRPMNLGLPVWMFDVLLGSDVGRGPDGRTGEVRGRRTVADVEEENDVPVGLPSDVLVPVGRFAAGQPLDLEDTPPPRASEERRRRRQKRFELADDLAPKAFRRRPVFLRVGHARRGGLVVEDREDRAVDPKRPPRAQRRN
mmetsp:Transcript_21443/g.69006  ORF Transcript_21443/g.69006 Transcript_21443/m.69006 type:complete len:207 (-) Transcript_21443:177-797(-)